MPRPNPPPPIPATIRPRLAQLIRMLTASDNEALTAARLIVRTLNSNGCDIHSLAAEVEAHIRPAPAPQPEAQAAPPPPPPPPNVPAWRHELALCILRHGDLRPREREFIVSIRNRATLTPRQANWLHDIAERLAA